MKVDGPRSPARRAHEGESTIDPPSLDEVKRVLIERVLDAQLGAGAPADLREELRAALAESLASDPFLRDKLRALGAE